MPNNQENRGIAYALNRRGIAYAFFDCDASIEQIERAMPNVRYDARTPENLQLFLQERISGRLELFFGETLAKLIQQPNDYRVMSSERIKQPWEKESKSLSSMRYTMIASYDGSNGATANELGDVVTDIHRKFDKDQDVFRGAVVYQKDGEYQFKE